MAGRAGVLEVRPFSQGEARGVPEDFLDRAFGDPESVRSATPPAYTRRDYLALAVRGGFPEPSRRSSPRTRSAWFANYVRAVTERDIREMVRVNAPGAAGAVLRGLAAMSAQILVTSNLASRADLPRSTVDRYVELLEAVFLVHRLPPWSRNLLTRAVRHPKVHLVDTGLLCHLLGATVETLSSPTSAAVGPVMETFVVNEIAKQGTWSQTTVRLHHHREWNGRGEADLIAEADTGRIVAFECKAAESVNVADFRHLRNLQGQLGDDFVHGFVVYLGRHVLSFGDGLTAVPVSMLWSADGAPATPSRNPIERGASGARSERMIVTVDGYLLEEG